MTEPIETFERAEIKFPDESIGRIVEHVEIFPSGVTMVKERDPGGNIIWYPPNKAPIVKET